MKGEKKREEQSRTLIFSNFPKDTQEDEIIDMTRAQIVDVIGEVEEVFAYAKTGSRWGRKVYLRGLSMAIHGRQEGEPHVLVQRPEDLHTGWRRR